MLYRRVCLLQAQGRSGEAAAWEASAFGPALEAYRTSPEGREIGEPRLNFWLGLERRRVADASVLAELLAPLVAERLGSHSAALSASQPASTEAFAPAQRPRGQAAPPPAVAPSITDLLDGMLSQDRAESRQRRAS